MELRPSACERAAQFVSLELDGELSLFERAMLKRHLQRCEPCAVYARDVTGLTELLRAAPPEQISVPVVVSRPARRTAHIVQSVAAVAAVVVVGAWLGISSSGHGQAPGPVATFNPESTAGAVSDGRYDWPAGLPRTPQVIRFVPGGLYTSSVSP